jgi:peptidyl-prolyl cis-trans isomerase SurA
MLLIAGFCVFGLSISPARSEELIDEIVAIVDESIILKSDVFQQMAFAALQQGLSREQLAGRAGEDMFRSILDNMIQDELLIAKAKEDSIEIPSSMIEQRVREQLKKMKEEHGAAEFSRQLANEDLTEREVRDRLRKRFHKDAVRQRMKNRLIQEISVSPKEIAAFRRRYDSSLPPVYSVSHIMVSPVPSEDRQTEAREKAAAILERVRNGEDFAELARTYSEDPGSGPRGGDLGFFGKGDMVSEVESVVYAMAPGEISEVIQSEFGFHVLKMEEIQGLRVRARHILFAVQPSEADAAAAYQKAVKLYERIVAGEDFAELAKTESDHEETSEGGGKLGNYTEDQPPPGFASILSTMALGSVSKPVKTEFGWHLVKVTDDDETLQQIVGQVKMGEYFERILAETREKLYIDIRFQ